MDYSLAFGPFEVVAWGTTISFAVADVLTTSFDLSHPMLTAAVPINRWVIARFGWSGLALEHALTLVPLAVLWQALPRPYRVVVPLRGLDTSSPTATSGWC